MKNLLLIYFEVKSKLKKKQLAQHIIVELITKKNILIIDIRFRIFIKDNVILGVYILYK